MSVITRTDVTAVKLYENYVLAGIGSWLYIFERESANLIQKIHALHGQKVYSFVLSNKTELLVIGGKQFTIITKTTSNTDEIFVKSFKTVVCNDWLHSGIWLAAEHIALLTAHGVVQRWDITKSCLLSEHISKENPILYSGLLLPIVNDILVFSGTVFSAVLIHRCGSDKILHTLKGHKGVIFSISCNLQKGVIVTTSDDRSLRIWQIDNMSCLSPSSIEYWENVNIICTHELYGHLSRIMRNCIKDKFVISVGEDACICFWDYNGNLLRKLMSHQNACIWSLDADDKDLLTGGGDCGVMLHPLSMVMEYGKSEVLDINITDAKKVVFTERRNIVIVTESGNLMYYDTFNKSTLMLKLQHKSTYRLLSISPCKQIIAVSDMSGKLDIFIEPCKGPATIKKFIDAELEIGKILFMGWAGNRHIVFSSENGVITVVVSKDNTVDVFANFVLPPCKERWLTATAINLVNDMLIVGDRCGSLHVYIRGQKNALKSLKNIHGRYGPTSINILNNDIVTTGRDGTIKYFRVDENCDIKYMSSRSLDFQWVEAFIDKDKNYICGFQERIFMVYDTKNNSKLLEVSCGGGRRSWDIVRYIEKSNDTFKEFIKFVYLKNANVNIETFELDKVVSKYITNGTHSKEINCLKTYVSDLDSSITFLISGGEDTTLRLSSINSTNEFQERNAFKQLSCIRTIKFDVVENNKLLLVSAGGRAQICVKLLHFVKHNDVITINTEDLCDYLVNGNDKERKGNQALNNSLVDFDPETRIMDLEVIKRDERNFSIFAGCSDAVLRVFNFEFNGNSSILKPTQDLKYHDTCILKTNCFKLRNKLFLTTCTTRGVASFWDVTNGGHLNQDLPLEPVMSLFIHKSGINSLDCKVISDKEVFIVTGGDDNTVHFNHIEICENLVTTVKSKWSISDLHCSEITGIKIIEDLIASTSIDQRITLLRWNIADEMIKCEFVSQVFSDVPDIQGFDVLEHDSASITLCVFGKGIEVIRIRKSPQ